MNELSCTRVIDLGWAAAQRGARAAAPVAARVPVKNSRRLLMKASVSVVRARRRIIGKVGQPVRPVKPRSCTMTAGGRSRARGDHDMSSWSTLEEILTTALSLDRRPVAGAF